ncbi:RNA polymerase sigma factor [Actinomadura fulvescens]|uniref:RNA polymerase sigma factor n=1 Tax=Actinomadura fulvescens TaxID=46160 RepID=A0ABP6C4G5_9ACTN
MLTAPLDTAAAAEDESDAALVRESLSRPEAFAAVFDRHSDEVYRYVARRLGPEAAEDIVADTFLTAFRKRGGYDVSRPDARPWLYGIATNLIRTHRRAEVRRNRALARSREPEVAESFDERSAARVTAERLQPRLAAVLGRLSTAERDLLLLIAWADLTYEEAAQALGVPMGTVRSRLHRIRKKLRRALGGDDPMATNEESLA